MRDTKLLDLGEVSIHASIDASSAQKKAIEWFHLKHASLQFEASEPVLKIYCPSVAGKIGNAQLVWEMKVRNTGELIIHESVLVDAYNGQIALHYSLICYSINRKVTDYDPEPDVDYTEQDPPTEGDADKAWDYMQDFYDFYNEEHDGWKSWDEEDALMHTEINKPGSKASWSQYKAVFGTGHLADDVLTHEFTHGVTKDSERGSGLLYIAAQSGAIHESLSDMWGEWIDLDNNHGDDTSGTRWLFGEEMDFDYIAENENESAEGMVASRYLKYPTLGRNNGIWYGNQPDRLSDYQSGTIYIDGDPVDECHHNSGIGNKLAYLLTDGGTHYGYSITGLNISGAADLFFECQVHLLMPASGYYDLGCFLQLAAANIGLSDSQRYNVEKACKAVEIYEGGAVFVIENSSGDPVAWFDDQGNMMLKGILTENEDDLEASAGSDEFRVQDSEGNDVAIINMSTGYMVIDGDLDEETTQSPSGDDFVVKDGSGTVVAFIDSSTGDLCLDGKLYQPKEDD